MLGFCLNSCVLGKLLCEMSYVAAKKVVDGCNNMTTFWSCCKNHDIATLVNCSTCYQ